MIITSFILSLVLFIIVGMYSMRQRKKHVDDYLLASRDVPPFLAAMSMMATNNSGFMFIGVVGMTYSMGLSVLWLGAGWVLGDLLMWYLTYPKLRQSAEESKSVTYAQMISRFMKGEEFKVVRKVSALVTVAFLGAYAAAQLTAGSKALHVLLGWDYASGAIIGALIALAYCWAGGIRATIWTDTAQSIVMIFAMLSLFVAGVSFLGGPSAAWENLSSTPDVMKLFPDQLALGPLMFIAGWFFAGIGTVGQPHIVVRIMTMNNDVSVRRARVYYIASYALFFTLTVSVALLARLILPDLASIDPELGLPSMAQKLLPEFMVGMILAGLFAATISTADSQIISAASAITEDLLPKHKNPYLIAKIGTVSIIILTLIIALLASESVSFLILMAWTALGSIFAPTLILLALGVRLAQWQALFMMGVGFATVVVWREFGLSASLYEVLPGIVSGFIAYAITKPFTKIKRG